MLKREVEYLIAEIGSTTTLVSAFDDVLAGEPIFLGQGQAPTTVLAGDVSIGLNAAIENLQESLQTNIKWKNMVATSSAAGGLKMTVHGLVYDMTVKAAKEAALGAGANIHMVTAGELTEKDLGRIEKIAPNVILLAGGVDYGEKETATRNAEILTKLSIRPPVIYAGNIAVADYVKEILQEASFEVTCVENVYPRIDSLNVEPTRRAIHKVFERHITEAPGMQKIRQLIDGRIIPTPGAVMKAAKLLAETVGDVIVVDVGGATTDVHSVAEGDPELASLLINPEPLAKRTVEGDLGVFINAENVMELCEREFLCDYFDCEYEELRGYVAPIPQSEKEKQMSTFLTETALQTAVKRHAGMVEYVYGPTGRTEVIRGKDLTCVRYIIATGGALTKLPGGKEMCERLNMPQNSLTLFPRVAKVLLDKDYIMAGSGLLADKHPQAAMYLMQKSFGCNYDII